MHNFLKLKLFVQQVTTSCRW